VAQGQRWSAAAAPLQVQQGEPHQVELLVDHALAETGGDAEADALGQRLDHRAHVALVARRQRRQAIAHHNPVDRPATLDGANLALLPDGFRIDRRPHDLQRVGIDPGQKIEIDETVVQRRQQRVGPGVSQPAEMGVAARRVDDPGVRLRRSAR